MRVADAPVLLAPLFLQTLERVVIERLRYLDHATRLGTVLEEPAVPLSAVASGVEVVQQRLHRTHAAPRVDWVGHPDLHDLVEAKRDHLAVRTAVDVAGKELRRRTHR